MSDVRLVQEHVNAYSMVSMAFNWQVPDGTRPGDTITIALPDVLAPAEGLSFPLTAPDGAVVATGEVTRGHRLVLTMTDYVTGRVGVHGTAQVDLHLDRGKVRNDGSTYELTFTVGARAFTDSFTTRAPWDSKGMDERARKWMVYWPDADDAHRLAWGIDAPRITGDRVGAMYTWTDVAEEGQQITCGSTKGEFVELLYGDTYVDGSLTRSGHGGLGTIRPDRWEWNCTPQRLTVTFDTSRYSQYDGKIPTLKGFSHVTVPGRASYTNGGTVRVANAFTQDVDTQAVVPSGSGTGHGTTPPAPEPTPTPTPSAPEVSSPPPTSEPSATHAPGPTPTPTPEPTPTETTPAPEPTSASTPEPTTAPAPEPTQTPTATATTPEIEPTPEPTETTPAPEVSSPPPTSEPTATAAPDPTPTPTATETTPPPAPTPAPTSKRRVTRTFQVDRYERATSVLARKAGTLAADGLLGYREDRPFWGHSRWEFVTVTVPVDATTDALIKAVNAKATLGDITTSSRQLATRRGTVLMAWELGAGATPTHPWGPRRNVPQTYLGRS